HALSAAHKTLPIPCWVEVHNLKNNKKLIVRVNDRGPFVENRIIDLSFAAATRLGIVRDGTALVEVRALSFDDQGNALTQAPRAAPAKVIVAEPPAAVQTEARVEVPVAVNATDELKAEVFDAPISEKPESEPQATLPMPAQDLPATAKPDQIQQMFAQVGAFSSIDNAERLFIKLRELGFDNARILEDLDRTPRLFRIQVGPVTDRNKYEQLLERLASNGIEQATLVIN
ncbi:MAG: septal ring lytic transglycosylase RlpA family protein, partial [Pseudomonadota bacterium]